MLIILTEEIAGPYATPHLPVVLALKGPWLLMPLLLIWGIIARASGPFTPPDASSVPVSRPGTTEGVRELG